MQAHSELRNSLDATLYEKTIASRTVFSGRALTLDVVDICLPDGRKSTREIVRHRGASAILARLPNGRFLFVRQYRKAVERVMVEVVAGCMDVGETPLHCAHRELREESGYAARDMRALGSIVACPGYSEEILHLFFAELEEAPGATEMDSDEHVQALSLDEAEVDAAIRSGRMDDAKTLACWFLWRQQCSDPSTPGPTPASEGSAP